MGDRDPELELQIDELCLLDTNREPTESEIYDIYSWIDHLEFSRPRRNLTRDFSDGVLVAEIMAFYVPYFCNVRNFTTSLSKKNKRGNWSHLNSRVFNKLGYKADKNLLEGIMDCKPWAVEKLLFELRPVLARRNRSILNYRVGKMIEAPEKYGQPIYNRLPTTPTYASKRKSEVISISRPATANNEKATIRPTTRSRPLTAGRIPIATTKRYTEPYSARSKSKLSKTSVSQERVTPKRSRPTAKSRSKTKLNNSTTPISIPIPIIIQYPEDSIQKSPEHVEQKLDEKPVIGINEIEFENHLLDCDSADENFALNVTSEDPAEQQQTEDLESYWNNNFTHENLEKSKTAPQRMCFISPEELVLSGNISRSQMYRDFIKCDTIQKSLSRHALHGGEQFGLFGLV